MSNNNKKTDYTDSLKSSFVLDDIVKSGEKKMAYVQFEEVDNEKGSGIVKKGTRSISGARSAWDDSKGKGKDIVYWPAGRIAAERETFVKLLEEVMGYDDSAIDDILAQSYDRSILDLPKDDPLYMQFVEEEEERSKYAGKSKGPVENPWEAIMMIAHMTKFEIVGDDSAAPTKTRGTKSLSGTGAFKKRWENAKAKGKIMNVTSLAKDSFKGGSAKDPKNIGKDAIVVDKYALAASANDAGKKNFVRAAEAVLSSEDAKDAVEIFEEKDNERKRGTGLTVGKAPSARRVVRRPSPSRARPARASSPRRSASRSPRRTPSRSPPRQETTEEEPPVREVSRGTVRRTRRARARGQ